MTNILPSGIGDLFQLGGRVFHGLRRHGPWVLKNFITAEEMRGGLTTAQRTEAAFARARAARAVAEARCVEAEEKLTPWLAKARLVVMLALGSKWSQSWVAAGFAHRGTNVPKKLLRWKMGAVRGALSVLLARDDSRWAAFGFNIPHPDAPAKKPLAPASAQRPVLAPSFAVMSPTTNSVVAA